MGHHGKHIIDPETGLCEICDKDAIQEVRHGKRPRKHIFYSNHDDRIPYPPNDEIPYTKDRYVYQMDDEPRPYHIRKTIYPAPTIRPRRPIYEQRIEEPTVIRRKIMRHDHAPPEDVIIHHLPPPRPTTFYYVDKEGQIVPQNNTPPPEPPRRYIVQNRHPPPERTVRVIRRQAQTPPPPASEAWQSGPRRQINSDTEIIERQQRMRREDSYSPPALPAKPEMYYIETVPNHKRFSPGYSPMNTSRNNNSPPPKVMYPSDENRKQNKIEPFERKNPNQSGPAVVRRVYKKAPPGKYEPPNNAFISNENHPRSVRKPENNLPPPRQYRSSPPITNRSPEPTKNPSIYYIRSVDGYE